MIVVATQEVDRDSLVGIVPQVTGGGGGGGVM